MNRYDVECVSSTGCVVGESPLWSPSEQLLWWVDIQRAKLHRYNPATGDRRRYDLPLRASALALCSDGRLLMAGDHEIGVYDPATEAYETRVELTGVAGAGATNDSGVAPDGSFWFGVMDAEDGSGAGAYFRLRTDFRVEKLDLPAVSRPNMMAFSPDETVFYTCDTEGQEILAYDYEGGAARGGRVFATTDASGGYPDGGAVDADGRVWVCHWGAGRVCAYGSDGRAERVVPLPVSRPTSCAFGGADRRTLFITTSRIGLDPDALEAEPFAGGLFALRAPAPGLAPRVFRPAG